MAVTIRKAKENDLDSLTALWHGLMDFHTRLPSSSSRRDSRKLANDAEKTWRAFVRKWIRSRNGLVIVAEDDGNLVGYSLNYIKANIPIFELKRFGHIGDLFIQDGYRGKGIGSAFRKKAFAWFKKKGLSFASISVHPGNDHAKDVYFGWGFEENHIEMIRRL